MEEQIPEEDGTEQFMPTMTPSEFLEKMRQVDAWLEEHGERAAQALASDIAAASPERRSAMIQALWRWKANRVE